MIPAIIVRRIAGETPEQFTARRDACRNESARQGFSTPESFGANIFDEDTFVVSRLCGTQPHDRTLFVPNEGGRDVMVEWSTERLSRLWRWTRCIGVRRAHG